MKVKWEDNSTLGKCIPRPALNYPLPRRGNRKFYRRFSHVISAALVKSQDAEGNGGWLAVSAPP